ncbi:MAG: hypothetical protein SVP26_04290 [Chloroflexota bacterium]|nr:hypothetical protein [Chloroflexota bacterium]
MALEGQCRTTAMAIMPHTDVEEALRLVSSLDVPFWPQLPRIGFHEDMYAQASVGFPGVSADMENEKVVFDSARFYEELTDFAEKMDRDETYELSGDYSTVYRRFLEADLSGYHAIHGQVTGAVSLGFNVLDEERKPIIYNDEVRALLFDFIQKKVNVQYRQLRQRNRNAFVWVDEPGLGFVFSGLSGYNDMQAKRDYASFVQGLEGPRGLHLCPNVNLPYLLGLGVDLLSFDGYQMESMPVAYASAVADFLRDGRRVISWGIVPTESAALSRETPQSLAERLAGYWEVVAQRTDVCGRRIAEQALIAPARCCVRDMEAEVKACQPGAIEEESVARAFGILAEVSGILRDRYGV